MADEEPAFTVWRYACGFELEPDGRWTRTEACNAPDPRTGSACALDVGHAAGHSWERPIGVLGVAGADG